jgi:hypothetical protein
MKKVENFESSIHEWKFIENEDSEGELFDGEGWNMKFWRDRLEGQSSRERRSSRPSRSLGPPLRIRERSRSHTPPAWRRSKSPSRSLSPRRRRSPPSRSGLEERPTDIHPGYPGPAMSSVYLGSASQYGLSQPENKFAPAPANSGYLRTDAGSQQSQASSWNQVVYLTQGRRGREEYDRSRNWR